MPLAQIKINYSKNKTKVKKKSADYIDRFLILNNYMITKN